MNMLFVRQILLLNAVKDVAKAMSELINNTKIASGMPSDHPSTEDLNTAAKVYFLFCCYDTLMLKINQFFSRPSLFLIETVSFEVLPCLF